MSRIVSQKYFTSGKKDRSKLLFLKKKRMTFCIFYHFQLRTLFNFPTDDDNMTKIINLVKDSCRVPNYEMHL